MNTKDQPAQASGASEEAVREAIARIVRAHVVEPYASELTDELVAALRHSQPSVQVEGVGLHPATAKLVNDFAKALAAKLLRSQIKYGYTDGWSRGDWQDECWTHLRQHVEKGDPLDVAAYCAFMWSHGWSTAPVCPTCKGIGVNNNQPDGCSDCGGTGKDRLAPTPDHAALVEALETARRFIADNEWSSQAEREAAKPVIAKLDAALSQSKAPQAGGEQWKLVPVEPTKEQVQAGSNATLEHFDFIQPGVAEAVYRAMVATTPSSRAEPVAWRWHWRGGDEPDVWGYSETPIVSDEHRHAEPLYASPLSSRAEVV